MTIGRATRVRVVAITRYAVKRTTGGRSFLNDMLAPAASGRSALDPRERTDALRADAVLARLGVRCLWRSAVVVEGLRRAGVAARIGIAVSMVDPHHAHAEPEVGDLPLRPREPDTIPLR